MHRTIIALLAGCLAACASHHEPTDTTRGHLLDPSDRHDDGCGNGFCEPGEDHASCPNDCCERGPNDACVATCGTASARTARHTTRARAIAGGCWHCDDPFACMQGAVVPPPAVKESPHGDGHVDPKPKPPPPPPAHRCGDGRCDEGESADSCPVDCGTAGPRCRNFMCEVGEDHAGCPSDCCELGPDGSCAPTCGNGFCETGESHATCAADCCETLPSGACTPVCGNGFCEIGEDAATCPGDCH